MKRIAFLSLIQRPLWRGRLSALVAGLGLAAPLTLMTLGAVSLLNAPVAHASSDAGAIYDMALTLQNRSNDIRSSQQLNGLMTSHTPGVYVGLSIHGVLDFSKETASLQNLFYRQIGNQLRGEARVFYDQLWFDQASGQRYGAMLAFSHSLMNYRLQYQFGYTRNNTHFQLKTGGQNYHLYDSSLMGSISLSMPIPTIFNQTFTPYGGLKLRRTTVKAVNEPGVHFDKREETQPQIFLGFNYQWENVFHLFGLGLTAGYRFDMRTPVESARHFRFQQQGNLGVHYNFAQAQLGLSAYVVRSDNQWHVAGGVTTRWWF